MTRSLPIPALLAVILLAGCVETDAPDHTEAERALEWGARYLESEAVGRAALEASLVETTNGYASLRLQNYGPGLPWSELEVADWPTRPVTDADVGTSRNPWQPTAGDFAPLGELDDWTHEALLAYGERAFFNYPLGDDQRFAAALDTADEPARFGLWRDEGRIGGLVRVRYSDSSEAFAPTCGTCHASVVDGELSPGRPNPELAYSDLVRHAQAGDDVYPLGEWGAGSVDVTPDEAVNPVAMADLRAVRHQRNLHWAATLDNSLAALTVRIETLIITSLGNRRPPREVAFAIAYYLWNLGLEGTPGDASLPGAEVFQANCASCHGADGRAGAAVAVDAIGTEGSVARSSMRGLREGRYRVPSLWKVGTRGQLLHDGSVASLDAFLDPKRLETVPGHLYGTDLDVSERADLIAFLRTIGDSSAP